MVGMDLRQTSKTLHAVVEPTAVGGGGEGVIVKRVVGVAQRYRGRCARFSALVFSIAEGVPTLNSCSAC